MRRHAAAVAVAGLFVLSIAIVAAGRHIDEPVVSFDPEDTATIEDIPAPVEPLPEEQAAAPATAELERIAPRPPLSELATPQPPKPPKAVPPDRWKPRRVFNPVAVSAGQVEADGHRIAFAGLEPFPADEKCSYAGSEWSCGAQARTAFRAWLRGRALLCKLPPSPERQIITAECQVGKEDPAQWLAEHGWAHAAAEGAYAAAGQAAERDKKGIFGPPLIRP